MVLKALPALILIFFVWPITLGAGLGIKRNIDRYLIGFATVQALFFLVYIPAIHFSWSSRTLTYTAAIIITIVGVGGAFIRYYRAPSRKDFLSLSKPNFAYLNNPFFLVAIGIVLYEMWVYAVKEPYIYGDDVTYIRMVTDIVDTNEIYTKTWGGQSFVTSLTNIDYKYVFTSYYPFLGMISIITSLHPLILCKTVIPLVYIPIHYCIIWRIGSHLFDSNVDKRSLFMFFYSLLIEFGMISYYVLSRRVTIWIYNNKSDCFCLLLIPLFFYTNLLLCDEQKIGPSKLWYRLLIIGIIAFACNSSSLMGIIMSGMIIVLWTVIIAIRSKKASLLFYSPITLVPHAITALLIARFIGWFG